MRRLLILFLLTAACLGAQGQQLDPDDYIYPLRELRQQLYSANFGEIRPGHFHAGVDIKTDGVEGKPLVAAADGYVSRVVLQAGGYGRAVYLTLSNGTTAVYGHLQRFRDDIEQHVRKERYNRRSNSVNLWFGPETWPVKQGDVVGYSGNSGSSGGPHLHYEIRDTETQRLYNPVREGIIRPRDEYPPRIMRLHYVEVDTVQGVPVRSATESYAVVRTAEGRYALTHDGPVGVGRKGYFVAEVTDRRNDVWNTFGVWRLTAFTDGIPFFEFRMDSFTYDVSRSCDAVSCYPIQINSRNEAIRLAQLEGAPDCFYPTMEERGLIRTAEGQERRIRIEAEDDCGNVSTLEFAVRGRAGAFRAKADTSAVALRPDRVSVLRVGDQAEVCVPEGTIYEPIYVRPGLGKAPKADSGIVILSPAYRFFDPTTPLFHPVEATLRAPIPRPLQLQAKLAVRTRKGSLACIGGAYAGGGVTASVRTAGDLAIVADTLPPAIRPLFNEGADLSRAGGVRFRATDNFSGIASWSLHIDGEWVPCDRFPMKGTLVHFFDAPAQRRTHAVRLSVTDGCGNTTHFDGTFYR
ncbi:M23 family metallopeptidase [Alistipes sp.]|uniref:M23 family metallopeptidase n=1 Tax=Alistipes sp. TaxID=1872444 RepID=UPI0025C48C68|nr:M23 family metallopeptidase [Alistipes sp.]